MKNVGMSLENYKKYLNIFRFDDDDQKEINKILNKVMQITLLKRETVQTNKNLYLKPIMLPEDYKRIDRVLVTQKKFKCDRILTQYKKELEEKDIKEDEIKELLEKKEKELIKELGIKKSTKSMPTQEENFTLEDLKDLEEMEGE